MSKQYHTIVIGAGSGGLTVAIGLGLLGKKVLLVERGLMGGECTNFGCVPSKSLLHQGKKGVSLNEALYETDKIVQEIRSEESAEVLAEHGVEVLKGNASFIDSNNLLIDSGKEKVRAGGKNIVIATGSNPRMINIEGLPNDILFTNQNIFEKDNRFKHLVIVGSGPIGMEMADAFNALGVKVSLINRSEHILNKELDEVGKLLKPIFEQKGVDFYLGVDTNKISYQKGSVIFTRGSNANKKLNGVDGVLVAIGRVPNYKDLQLKKVGVSVDRCGIITDEKYRTNVKNIYAIGDVICGPKFTHMANAQGRSVMQSIAYPFLPTRTPGVLPRVTYTKPEVSSVGFSTERVGNLGESYVKIRVELGQVDRAKTDHISDGFLIVYAKRLTGKVVHATLVAENAGEMISYYTQAIQAGVSMWKLQSVIIPYPTMSEVFKKAADKFVVDTLRNIKSEVWFWLKSLGMRYGLRIMAVIFWLGLIGGVRWYLNTTDTEFLQLIDNLATFIRGTVFGPILYLGIYLLRPVILFPASLLTLLAGNIFGLWEGFVWALLGGSASSVLPYFTGRWLAGASKVKVENRRDEGRLAKYAKPLAENTFDTVLTMRLLFLPYDGVSILAGSIGANIGKFFLATMIGNVIGTFVYVGLGASVSGDIAEANLSVDYRLLLLSVGLLVVILGGKRVVSKYMKKRLVD